MRFISIYMAFNLGLAFAIPTSWTDSSAKLGLYVEICGSGKNVFFPLSPETPSEPSHHLTPCHAICAGREFVFCEEDVTD